jgi:uncharacterized membrane protein
MSTTSLSVELVSAALYHMACTPILPKYRESSLWSAGKMGVPSMNPPCEQRDAPKFDFGLEVDEIS